jgi:hypothetical protein
MKNYSPRGIVGRTSLLLGATLFLVTLPFGRGQELSASEDGDGGGTLQITKECSHYTGAAGSFCTITASNVAAIPPGSTVYYTQGAVSPLASEATHIALDSNVVLFVDAADWATGRCTLGTASSGLCTFTDGIGALRGFHAHVSVAYTGGPNFSWTGPYSLPDSE